MSTLTFFIIVIAAVVLSSAAWLLVFVNTRKKWTNKIKQLTADNDNLKHQHSITEQEKTHAEAANLAKNKYLSGVSHELRTPLNVIMGYAQLLENNADKSDPNLQSYALIRKNCEHLSHLVEGILEFSAIESGKLRVQSEIVDLQELLLQIEQMYLAQAKQKDLSFEKNVTDNLPQFVKTDGKRLKQILLNLLSNAIKFTEQGFVRLSVSYRNQIATFEVADSGYGIDNNLLDDIFNPFERIEQTGKNIPGTGLGLTIAKLLTELMGGELTVESKPNQGTVFRLKLMLSAQYPTTNPGEELKVQTSQQTHRILIVDDVEEHRELLTHMIESYGFEIDRAEHPSKARELIKQNDYDLAFFDIAMPDENGWQLAAWCRENHYTFKIVMVSANPRDKQGQTQSHHQAYISKPIRINTLLTTMNQLLNLGWEFNPPQPSAENFNNQPLSQIFIKRDDRLTLQQLIDIGHINGIEKHLKAMQDKQAISEQDYQALSDLVKQLNLKKLATLIGINE